MKQQKEFDRSFCFTFYKSYYEQIMLVKENYGTEKAFEVFQSIAEYGLYQKEIVDKEILMLMGTTTVEAIDSSQIRRSNGFVQEDFESTYAIVVYHRDHPEASQRTIAAATGVGKTKVQRVLAKIKESGLSIDDYISDVIIPNLNHNDNNNYNTNNNCIDQDQCDQIDQSQSSHLTELADAQTTASTMPTADAVPIAIFRNKTYNLGRFTKVSIDDKTKNEHMYAATFKMEDDSSLKEVLDCARINGVDKDYACSYISSNF